MPWALIAAAGCAGPGLASQARGQAPGPALGQAVGGVQDGAQGGAPAVAPAEPAEITGRDFAGLRLSIAPQQGELQLSGSRVSVWTEAPDAPAAPGPAGAAGQGGPVQRLLLRGDVRIKLGIYTFAAARASVWVERLEPSRTTPGAFINQVAIYFDRVSDPGGEAGVNQAGDRLLVTALFDGDVALRADSLSQARPASGSEPFLVESERRLARLLGDLAAMPVLQTEIPQTAGVRPAEGRGPIVPGMSQPFEPDSPLARAGDEMIAPPDLGPAERTPPVFAAGGLFTFAAGEPTLIAGKGQDENALMISGGVVVQYSETRRDRQLQISAERAVVFLEAGPVTELFRTPGDKVKGIYLEGDVIATDGRFTLRGPRIYYDVRNNRAYVVDAVFWTYDLRRGMPLYVRAKALMQTAANQITGREVTISNSSFFQPHLALGATSITVTREQIAGGGGGGGAGAGGLGAGGGGPARTYVDGRDLVLKAGSAPFFYYPRFSGDVDRFPLKEVRFENSSDSGFAVKTLWDVFGLAGYDAPTGVRADLLIDAYVRRGIGLGTDGRYDLGANSGSFLAYVLPNDNGRDTLTSGAKIKQDDETRGIILADHRWSIDDKTQLLLEGSYVSDETFVDAFYESLAETRREFATSADLRRVDGNTAASFYAKTNFNDFTPNEYLLQSQGYTVEKLPEFTYARVSDSILDGAVSYSSSYAFSNMALNFVEKTPAQIGFDTPLRAGEAFGLNPNDRIDEVLRGTGLRQDQVLRFDTRQELSTTIALGPVKVTPFGVGRFTAYDTDFNTFTTQLDDQYRYWLGGGARVSTSVQRVDETVESRFFDLHKIRHIIEPSVTAWSSGTNVESADLPVYDDRTENIADGSAVRIGLDQTWQTQRGGPGRYRSVDFLKLNGELVYSSEDAPRKSPIGQFFDYRPEYSVLGNFATVDGAWQATDAVALTINEVYDLDLHQSSRTTAGGAIQHSQDFSTFAEAHFINARNSTFVTVGADYRLTRKWTATAAATYDVEQTDFQELGVRLNREFPSSIVSLKLRYNNITDEVALGFALSPKFGDERGQLTRRLGRDQFDIGETPPDAVTPNRTLDSQPLGSIQP